MKRADFPSSPESIDRIIEKHELTGQKLAKKELTKEERTAFRNYLAGAVNSTSHTSEVSTRITLIRSALGLNIFASSAEKTRETSRLIAKIRSSMDRMGIDAKALKKLGVAKFAKYKFATYSGTTIIAKILGEKRVTRKSINRLADLLFEA